MVEFGAYLPAYSGYYCSKRNAVGIRQEGKYQDGTIDEDSNSSNTSV